MEKVIEENSELHLINKKNAAQKKNAVELKTSLRLPNEILYLFAQKNSKEESVPGRLKKITCIQMFESAPQSKCAVSYKI